MASASLAPAQREQALELGVWVLDPRYPEWLVSIEGQRRLLDLQRYSRELLVRLEAVKLSRLQAAAALFLEQLAEDCERLHQSATAAAAAHRIASAAFGLGLDGLAEQALAAEQALQADSSAPVDRLLECVASAQIAVQALIAMGVDR